MTGLQVVGEPFNRQGQQYHYLFIYLFLFPGRG
jgi:hypothetical protein